MRENPEPETIAEFLSECAAFLLIFGMIVFGARACYAEEERTRRFETCILAPHTTVRECEEAVR